MTESQLAGGKMHRLFLSLVAFFISWHQTESLSYTVTAPNTLRYNVEEAVGITVMNVAGDVAVKIELKDFPAKKTFFSQDIKMIQGKPGIAKVIVKPENIPADQKDDDKIFVYLVVTSTNPQASKELKIPVTRHSGYAFIQTDKPIYLPNQDVHMRMLSLDEKLLPSKEPFSLEVKNPNDVPVFLKDIIPDLKGLNVETFKFSSLPMKGTWKVSLLYGKQKIAKVKTYFEVQEYVLPTFEVKITPPVFVLPNVENISGEVSASYVYGKPVNGVANLKFSVKMLDGHVEVFVPDKRLQLRNGKSEFTISVETIKNNAAIPWFPAISGSNLLIEAKVMETATGNVEKAADESTVFTTSPYVISFPRSLRDFKPGVTYEIQVDVRYANNKPVPNIKVKMEEGKAWAAGNAQLQELAKLNTRTTDALGRAVFQVDTQNQYTKMEFTIVTVDEAIAQVNQARGILSIAKFNSPDGNSYVWIQTPEQQLTAAVGSVLSVKVTVYPIMKVKLHYLVVTRGMITALDETDEKGDALIRTIQFPVTVDMSPSSRLVVYYIKNNKIIADSVVLDVERKCKYNNGNELTMRLDNKENTVKPGKSVTLSINGEKRSHVAMVVVDEAIYLLNKGDRLTRDKMFNEMQKHDLGCGPGGGLTTEDVFRNAGLAVVSSAEIKDHGRLANGCGVHQRKRRSAAITRAQLIAMAKAKVKEYDGDKELGLCCHFGQLPGPTGLNCSERATIIHESNSTEERHACARAFLDCCRNLTESLPPIYNGTDDDFGARADFEHIDDRDLFATESGEAANVRKYFPESWLFNTYRFGDQDCGSGDANSNKCELKLTVPHSITTWLIQAIGISDTTGICVAEELRLTAFKQVFIQLNLPYAAVRGEQIEVQATVFNYGTDDIPVTVYMYGVEGLCMGADAGKASERKKIVVKQNSAHTVTFPVMPLDVADYTLKVVALSEGGSDIIEKKLKVIPEGIPKTLSISRQLDPTGLFRRRRKRDVANDVVDQGDGVRELYYTSKNQHTIEVDVLVPENHVPGTARCTVSLIGDVMGPAVTTALQGLEGRFMTKPHGCGEQTMIFMAPIVYTLMYLKRNDRLTADIERLAYSHMQDGFIHELNYRKAEGSFSTWTHSPGSTWLTAFVSRVFCQAKNFINIPDDVTCSAVNWLVSRQRADGAFHEAQAVVHREMVGGVQESDSSLTAFVLLSMLECKHCDSPARKLATAKAVQYLEQNLDAQRRPFALAIIAYALKLADSQRADDANEKLRELAIDKEATFDRYWNWDARSFGAGPKPWMYSHKPEAIAVETAGYALLTQLAHNDITYSQPIVNWLSKQRGTGGAFVSTQDTVVALQALAEYSTLSKVPELDMTCNVSSQANVKAKRSFHITKQSAGILHEAQIPVGNKLFIDSVGQGRGTVLVELLYNENEDEKAKTKFELSVKAKEYDEKLNPEVLRKPEFEDEDVLPEIVVRAIMGEDVQKEKFGLEEIKRKRRQAEDKKNENTRTAFELEICARFLEEQPAGMSILDVGIFTGYEVIDGDLREMVKDKKSKVSRFEITDRSVILYLDEVPHNIPLCLTLRTAEVVHVGKMQATAVKIYDYYEPDKSATTFYRPDNGSPLLQTICEGTQCICAEGQCPRCKPFDNLKNIQKDTEQRKTLLKTACDDHDFVWKGELTKTFKKANSNYFEFLVTDVLKEGIQKTEDVVTTTVTFSNRESCMCPEMERGQQYIIMGRDGFVYKTENDETKYKYLFDKSTSVWWYRATIKEIKDKEDQKLQKAFTWFYGKLKDKNTQCTT